MSEPPLPPLTPEEAANAMEGLQQQVAREVIGHRRPLFELTMALACGGHCLVEGVPGLGKTLLVHTIARVLGLAFSRVQCTPDLMPGDITGSGLLVDERGHERFQFQPGPLFANVVLVDEINRATPRTQSALLEAMQEKTVTVMGETHLLPAPFLLLATQNPIEMEGTYPLPEAQLDRFFFKIHLSYPEADELGRIITRSAVPPVTSDSVDLTSLQATVAAVLVPTPVVDYATRLLIASQPDSRHAAATSRRSLRLGISPRGGQCLIAAARAAALTHGRHQVDFADIREVALPALRHRLILNLEAQMEGITADAVVDDLLQEVAP